MLVFSQDRWLMKAIDNRAPFVDKIYVAWSDRPWAYNPNAAAQFKNRTSYDILYTSPHIHKIEIIRGSWDLEEDQRNACIIAAKRDGMDILMTQDTDEFYLPEDFEGTIAEMKNNPNHDYYTTPWYSFWKSMDYIMINQQESKILGRPLVAINLKKNDLRFTRARICNGVDAHDMNYILYHPSYVLTNEECWEKINTWGHAHQFNTQSWYNNIWLAWDNNKDLMNLHPIEPSAWFKVVKYEDKLPKELSDMK